MHGVELAAELQLDGGPLPGGEAARHRGRIGQGREDRLVRARPELRHAQTVRQAGRHVAGAAGRRVVTGIADESSYTSRQTTRPERARACSSGIHRVSAPMTPAARNG